MRANGYGAPETWLGNAQRGDKEQQERNNTNLYKYGGIRATYRYSYRSAIARSKDCARACDYLVGFICGGYFFGDSRSRFAI